HLADRFADKGLAPAPGTPERGRWYQWIVYAMTTLEPDVALFSELGRMPAQERSEALVQRVKAHFHKEAALAEQQLQGRQFVMGDRFSAADVVLGSVLSWARMSGLTEGLPACEA